MPYSPICLKSDIEAYFKSTFTSTSSPKDTDITSWINIATAMIYGAISSLYAVPVTDSADLAILKELCIAYVRDKVNYTQGANVYTVPGSNINLPRTIKYNTFEEGIKLILDGTITLLNTASNGIVAAKDYNSANFVEAIADKDEVQW